MEYLKNEKTTQRQQSPHDGSQRSTDNNELSSASSSAQITQPDSPLNKLVNAAGHSILTANMLRPYFLNTQTPTLNNNIYQFSNNEFNNGIHHQQQQQQLHQLQQQQQQHGHNQMQSLHGQSLSNHHHLPMINHQNLMHQQQQTYQQQQQQQYQMQLQHQQPQLMNYVNRTEKTNDDNDEENELINQANSLRNASCKY
jgi:hypothetical protein